MELDFIEPFPECVAWVPVSLWGSGGEAALGAPCCQPSATVCVTAVWLSLCADASGVVSKVCQVDP